MKLVRESLFEKFTEDGDPIEDMGIGMRAKIKKWFDSIGVKPDKYTIDDDLNINVKGSIDLYGTQITELPDNLRVEENLDLYGTPIIELPNKLIVRGYLDLMRTKITKLPDNISVGGTIFKDF